VPRALNMLRTAPHYRRECFEHGLRACGFKDVPAVYRPEVGDVLLIWNRYGAGEEMARHFEANGARVLVAENCPLGNELHGGSYSLAGGHVALVGGLIVDGGTQRWDTWGIEPSAWKRSRQTLILGQRGIGGTETRSPAHWAEHTRERIGGRIRVHPGTGPAVPLADDLAGVGRVVIWASAAAIQALLHGVSVWHEHPRFVGAAASRPLSQWPGEDKADDAARLEVFRRMAWAIWTLEEIRNGEAIAHALSK